MLWSASMDISLISYIRPNLESLPSLARLTKRPQYSDQQRTHNKGSDYNHEDSHYVSDTTNGDSYYSPNGSA